MTLLSMLIFGCTGAQQGAANPAAYSGPRGYMLAPAASDIIIHVHFDKYRDNADFAAAINSFFGGGVDSNVRALGLAAGISRDQVSTVTIVTSGSNGSSYRLAILDGNFSSNTFLAKSMAESTETYKGVDIYHFSSGGADTAVAILGTGVALAGSQDAVRDAIGVSQGAQGFFTGGAEGAFSLADNGSYITFGSKPSGSEGMFPKSGMFALGTGLDSSGIVHARAYELFASESEASGAEAKISGSFAGISAALEAAGKQNTSEYALSKSFKSWQDGNYVVMTADGTVEDFKAGAAALGNTGVPAG
ncbi:MAG TPA: hypothetical protein PLO51_04660 [Candidatus Micrarchaeota archaeon]|nr:hypothetical protein [Candidatus Micrarchaeota archaeon]